MTENADAKNLPGAMDAAVIGAGAWGATLAVLARRAGVRRCGLIGSDPERVSRLGRTREIPGHPNRRLDPSIETATSPAKLSFEPQIVLLALPVQRISAYLESFEPPKNMKAMICCSKGLDMKSAKTPYELAQSRSIKPLAVLSGPNFAEEILAGLPAATVIAADDPRLAATLVETLASPRFRPYASPDPIGVSLCGALKNCLALASGIVYGAGLGENARAALVTRAINEFRRWFPSLGANPDTLYGLAGLGDIVLSCSSARSRNFAYGAALAKGETLPNELAEGVDTLSAVCKSVRDSQKQTDISAPLLFTVEDVVKNRIGIDRAIGRLFSRRLGAEGH